MFPLQNLARKELISIGKRGSREWNLNEHDDVIICKCFPHY